MLVPRPRTWSIRTQLLVGVLSCGLGALFTVFTIGYFQLKNFAAAELEQSIARLVDNLAKDAEEIFSRTTNDLITLSQSPLFVDYHNNVQYQLHQEAATNRESLEGFLASYAGRAGAYPDIVFVDRRGKVVSRIFHGHPLRLSGREKEEKFSRPGNALPGGQDAWMELLPGPEEKELLYFSTPVRDPSGEPIGVLALGYDLTFLEKRLVLPGLGGRGRAFLEDSQGRVLAGNKPDFMNPIRASAPVRTESFITQDRYAPSNVSETVRNHWKVSVAVEPEYYLSPLRKIRNWTVVFGLFIGVSLAGMVVWVIGSLTRPIGGLIQGTKELASGNLDFRVEAGKTRELNLLASAFNDMGARLKEREREQKRLQTHLIQSEKLSAVGQLISGIAHELNNPLGGVTGYAELMLEEEVAPGLKHDLKQIHAHAMRCRGIIDNLLSFVRQGRQERKRVDLNEVVQSVLTLLEYRLTKADNIAIDFTRAKPVWVSGDFQQLQQVVVNLIQNACDAFREIPPSREKSIRLSVSPEAGNWVLEIKDNGPGIAPENLDKVFEPFFTTKEAGHGTGLGLAIVHQIVRDHGGELLCKSVLGQGTVFKVVLPQYQASSAAPASPVFSGPSRPYSKKKILVVDDEKELASMTARMLEKCGHEADWVQDAPQALEKIRNYRYDAVFLDLEMPGMGGRDLYEQLSRTDPEAARRLIFITGNTLNPKTMEFFKKNRIVYLAKPFSTEDLAGALDQPHPSHEA